MDDVKTSRMKMSSFRDFRELLVLSYDSKLISDTEFCFLYEYFMSKNPDFCYDTYPAFSLDDVEEAECKAEFRVLKQDLPRLKRLSGYQRISSWNRGVFGTVWKAYACFCDACVTLADTATSYLGLVAGQFQLSAFLQTVSSIIFLIPMDILSRSGMKPF